MEMNRRQFVGATVGAIAAGSLASIGSATFAHAAEDDLERWAVKKGRRMSVRVTALGAIYYPADLSASAPAPLIVWGNGTGAIPAVYRGLFEHWVSWGYVVYAAGTPNPAFGLQMRLCIDHMTALVEDPGSVFFASVDMGKIASAGHSQGGQAALNAAVDSRISTAIGIQPGPIADVTLVSAPILLLTGTSDLVVSPGLYVEPWMRDRATSPMVYGSLRGADHFEPVSALGGSGFSAVTTAWLEAALRREAAARRQFFGPEFLFSRSPLWSDVMRNSAASGLYGS